jgi:predicted small secreted protein
MKKVTMLTALIILSVLFFSACSKSNTTTGSGGTGGTKTFSCTGISPKFSTDVQPILTTVCSINSNCHAAGSTNSGGPFTSYTEVNARRSNIRAAILSGSMPQSGSISQAQINAFICWIDGGAPND